MQLGTRWPFGGEPPSRLPVAMMEAIREVETRTVASDRRWTLTWLEGLPLAELDPLGGHDEITIVRVDRDGTVQTTTSDSGEERVEE
ncbi:MAG: hypothetical protein KF801_07070 [Cryobacterium sp.]|nr:hypothetical protein [Cryobacterium sp.]